MTKSASFYGLAETLEEVRQSTGKNRKVELLAAYLRPLSPEDCRTASRIASGRPSERGSEKEVQVGYATIMTAVREATGASQEDVSRPYMKYGDLGSVVSELLASRRETTLFDSPLALADLEDSFERLRSLKGRGSVSTRKGVLKSLLLRATPVEGKYLVKVLTGEMRIGLVSGLLEESIAAAFSLSKEEASRTHMLLGDIGEFAYAARKGETKEVTMVPFRPINFMLAEPCQTPLEVAERFPAGAVAEYKYDGVRAQVHLKGAQVRVYSRRLEDITSSFPEVVSEASKIATDCILDGEIVPFRKGRPLPFQLLQRRLRRLDRPEDAIRNSPVVYFAFDLLFLSGEETIGEPFADRRRLLEKTIEGTGIRMAESVEVSGEGDVRRAFARSRELGYEGLVVKDLRSAYRMGKRGAGWVKLKEELDTIDAVIVAAEYGHGKRAGVISDYTFAVKDGDRLKTIGKAYSGLTDREIEEMTSRLKSITVEDHGYRRTVKPEIVVEVAFDSIQRSERHESGFALRFPRIKRVRTDKGADDVDSMERVRRIFEGQKVRL
jgi:DNA ligase 1